MKRTIYAVALLATVIGVAPAPAHAKKTLRQRVASLERVNKQQARQIQGLIALSRLANARAADAQSSYAGLVNCLSAQPAGPANVLSGATTSTFTVADEALATPDTYLWAPQFQSVIAADGDSFLVLLSPSCVAQPTAPPATVRGSWHPFKVVLR